MLPGMTAKPRIAIVGAGNLGTALSFALQRAGYTIDAVIARSQSPSRQRAQKLAMEVGARFASQLQPDMPANVVWFCVPDGEIASAARDQGDKIRWKGRVALHSSGALTSDELSALRERGAAVASVHPLMTFVHGSRRNGSRRNASRPSLAGVPFAVEGDIAAVRVARRIVGDLGGQAYAIRKSGKVAYHAWGMFTSPLFTALLVTAEQVAGAAGVGRKAARRRMIPILLQTLANYASFDAGDAFSGPIIRGDVATVRKHLQVLARIPEAREVYVALARSALRYLPAKNQRALERALAR